MSKVLQMVFKTTDGKSQMLKINDPKVGLARVQVETVMNEIIAKNVFRTSNGASLMAINGVYLVTTDKQEVLV